VHRVWVIVAIAPSIAVADPHPCRPGERDRTEWRYALVAGPFEPTQSVTADELTTAWRRGAIAADAATKAALAPVLGDGGAARDRRDPRQWAIVPAHELTPATSVIEVDGMHPLVGDGVLAVPMCGAKARNIDPAKLTTLVMSGTTALTGRTAERIDTSGVEDTIRYIKPFFTSADFVHISNEVAFVHDCKPWTGQKELIFCSRERYVELLEALHANLIELTGSHLVDYGERPLVHTIDEYAKRGWIWFGGGRTQLDATEPKYLAHHGNRLAFVGCNAVEWWVGAISPGPGVANCDWARMVWQIQDLRRRGFTPIATVQHRELLTHAPPPDLVHDLRKLAEAGAIFVLGSQAHTAHPWDVHFGAYVHYGPGNILFAQHNEAQIDASVDKLYIYDNRLLAVSHIFVRTEHGQPRTMTDAERVKFLHTLAVAAAAIDPPKPAGVPPLPTPSRARPDSLVIRGRGQHLAVTMPAHVEPGARYPLVIDVDAKASAGDDAILAVPSGKLVATGAEIAAFMRAKYPVDAARVTILGSAAPLPAHEQHRHHH
jgi:Bacterial capsule synthesis protein PGA_cap